MVGPPDNQANWSYASMGIEQKVEQMYKALKAMEVTEKLPSVKPEFKSTAGSLSVSYDFKKVQILRQRRIECLNCWLISLVSKII
jgi:hypothetical protein